MSFGLQPAGSDPSSVKAGGAAGVEPDGSIGCAAMLAQPRLEVGDQLRLGGCCHHGLGPADAELDEVPAKEPGTIDGVVVAPAALGAWTPAGAQVLIERREVNVRQARALLGHDVANVSRRPQVAHCCLEAIALPFQHLSKPVEVWPARPAAQMS